MPDEAVERFAQVWARLVLDFTPEADAVSVFRAEDVRPGRELAIATRRKVDVRAVVDDVQPLRQRRVA